MLERDRAGGGAFGLLLGGVLTDPLSWERIFFVRKQDVANIDPDAAPLPSA